MDSFESRMNPRFLAESEKGMLWEPRVTCRIREGNGGMFQGRRKGKEKSFCFVVFTYLLNHILLECFIVWPALTTNATSTLSCMARPHQQRHFQTELYGQTSPTMLFPVVSVGRCTNWAIPAPSVYDNNNVHLSCAHQRPERSHDTYQPKYDILYTCRA